MTSGLSTCTQKVIFHENRSTRSNLKYLQKTRLVKQKLEVIVVEVVIFLFKVS